MSLPTIAGVARASCGGPIAGGGRWNNNLHFRRTDLADPTEAQINGLAVVLETFYTAIIPVECAAPTALESIDITPLDGTSGAFHYTMSIVGAAAMVALPPEVAEVLTIRTADRGRRARGRIYLPAFQNGASAADGHIVAGTVTAVLSAATSLSIDAGAAGWQWGVASYGTSSKIDFTVTPHRRVSVSWTPFFTPTTSQSFDNSYDVIRGRKT